jgi:hypothetical protein
VVELAWAEVAELAAQADQAAERLRLVRAARQARAIPMGSESEQAVRFRASARKPVELTRVGAAQEQVGRRVLQSFP